MNSCNATKLSPPWWYMKSLEQVLIISTTHLIEQVASILASKYSYINKTTTKEAHKPWPFQSVFDNSNALRWRKWWNGEEMERERTRWRGPTMAGVKLVLFYLSTRECEMGQLPRTVRWGPSIKTLKLINLAHL